MVVELRWQHGLRHGEIAEVMGISVKGVENQLGRALKALRGMLGDFGD
jgi:DNA-directed RNA polymerase specialized sigma24 family protein